MEELNVVIQENVNVKFDNIKVRIQLLGSEEEEGRKRGWVGFLILLFYIKGIKISIIVDEVKNIGIFIVLKKIINKKLKIIIVIKYWKQYG